MKVGCGLPSCHFVKWQQQGCFYSPDKLSLQTTSPITERGVRNDKEGQTRVWRSRYWALRLIVREALAPPDIGRPLLLLTSPQTGEVRSIA